MGSLFSRDKYKEADHAFFKQLGSINLGKLITLAKGGDLILIQDMAYVDNYTLMNSQEAHYLKHFLRFKDKENPNRLV